MDGPCRVDARHIIAAAATADAQAAANPHDEEPGGHRKRVATFYGATAGSNSRRVKAHIAIAVDPSGGKAGARTGNRRMTVGAAERRPVAT